MEGRKEMKKHGVQARPKRFTLRYKKDRTKKEKIE
jgi:hypothetical protein